MVKWKPSSRLSEVGRCSQGCLGRGGGSEVGSSGSSGPLGETYASYGLYFSVRRKKTKHWLGCTALFKAHFGAPRNQRSGAGIPNLIPKAELLGWSNIWTVRRVCESTDADQPPTPPTPAEALTQQAWDGPYMVHFSQVPRGGGEECVSRLLTQGTHFEKHIITCALITTILHPSSPFGVGRGVRKRSGTLWAPLNTGREVGARHAHTQGGRGYIGPSLWQELTWEGGRAPRISGWGLTFTSAASRWLFLYGTSGVQICKVDNFPWASQPSQRHASEWFLSPLLLRLCQILTLCLF